MNHKSQMNIQIYLAWKKSTNIKTNEYIRLIYLNILEYPNICPTLCGHLATV